MDLVRSTLRTMNWRIKKQGAVTYSRDRENEVSKMFFFSWKLNRSGKHITKSSGPNWPSARSRWLDIGQVLLMRFNGPRRSRDPYEHKKTTRRISSHFLSHKEHWNNYLHTLFSCTENEPSLIRKWSHISVSSFSSSIPKEITENLFTVTENILRKKNFVHSFGAGSIAPPCPLG